MTHKKKKHNLLKTFLISVLVSVVSLFLIFYVAVAVYFAGHFGFNTYINGECVTYKTVKDLQKEVTKESSKYNLTIKGRNNTIDYISSADVSLKPKFEGEFETILKAQSCILWPITLFKTSEYSTDTVVEYSRKDLEAVVKNLTFFKAENIEKPENAYVSDTAGENGFEIIKETAGNEPIEYQIYSEIQNAVDVLADEITLSDACYQTANIKSDDKKLNDEINLLNEYCNVNIVYEFGDDIEKVDGNLVKDWLIRDGDQVSLDEDKVKEYVNSIARKYDTFGKKRTITKHDGETIELSGGDFGWWMDRSGETKALYEAIKNHESGTRTPIYFGTGVTYGESDIGDTYVEINLTDQHLWVYKEGEVVEESDFVSGCVKKGNETPVGTYKITYKERDATLKGQGYRSSVSYWMPFNGNVGMHDASWRDDFGGEIYVTGGSHGCINLPKKKAEAIYDIVTKGEPVVVYGGMTKEEVDKMTEAEQRAQLQQLIDAGLLNPDGTIPEDVAKQE